MLISTLSCAEWLAWCHFSTSLDARRRVATTLLWSVLGRCLQPTPVACFVHCLQDALIALIGVPPERPAITTIDGSRIVVRIAGTTPAPALLAVEGVEVQQECGPITAVAPTAADATLARTTPSDRLRLRWLKDGVRGPWSDWVPVVSGGGRELFLLPPFACQLSVAACFVEWGVCVRESLCL